MMFKIINCSKETEKYIRDWLNETDIEEFIEELSNQVVLDYLVYGYNPWDYLEETKLNMKHQKLIPILKRDELK